MKKIYVFIIFIAAAAVQLFIPIQMILDEEDILTNGTAYKFKTKPVDPNDPFRGKYIVLDYEIDSYKTEIKEWEKKEDVYVYLKVDSLGFAVVDTVAKQKIESTADYVIAKSSWYQGSKSIIHFDYDFNRFYMEEFKAKPAEDLVNDREKKLDAYALIYVKDGKGVVEDVFVDNIPIANYVEK